MPRAEGIDIDAVKGGELQRRHQRRPSRPGCGRGRPRPTSGASRTTCCSTSPRPGPRLDVAGAGRRRLEPALRADPAGQAGPRPGPGRARPRRRGLRVDAGRPDRAPRSPAGRRAVTAHGHGPGARRPAGDRGLHRGPARAAPDLAADELQPDRHRAAARPDVGARSAGPAARRSATRPTPTCTPSAPRTTGSRSAAAACPTGTARAPTTTARPTARPLPHCNRSCTGCCRPRGRGRSTTPGPACWPCRATGARPSGSTGAPASAGPAATSGTAWRPPTWPAARCATWSSAARTDLTALPWVGRQGAHLGAGAAALARRADAVRGVPGRRPARAARRPDHPAGPAGRPDLGAHLTRAHGG